MTTHRMRSTVLVGLSALVLSGHAAPSGPACAEWHGNYWESGYYDPNLACTFAFSGADEGDAYDSIRNIGISSMEGQDCMDIENYVISYGFTSDWTGNYTGTYWWDAFSKPNNHIGFHWDYITDEGLWAHEGAHIWLNDYDSETGANFYQNNCPYV